MQEVVNIIPCIAKADSFTSEELKDYKQTVSIICLMFRLRYQNPIILNDVLQFSLIKLG